MKDCHVHSNISHDGISSYEEYVNKAKTIGIDEITFTEHYDDYAGVVTDETELDLDVYNDAYYKFKNDNVLKTNFGLEVSLRPEREKEIKAYVDKYDFDFIIGANHITCGVDMAWDPSFFDNIIRREAYIKYFKDVTKNIKLYDNFDVYAHIDYVVRYGGYDEKIIYYDEFRDVLDEILKLLIRKDKGIEVNTSGLRYGLPFPHPNQDILNRFKELGGEIITIGSDAHRAEDLGKDLDIAVSMARKAGFKYSAIFHNRKADFINL